MNDQEIRGVVLKYLHSRNALGSPETDAEELIQGIKIPEERLGGALAYLESSGYLTVTTRRRGRSLVEKSFEITAKGIDLAEKRYQDAHVTVGGDFIFVAVNRANSVAAGKNITQQSIDVTLTDAPAELERALERFLKYVEEESNLPEQVRKRLYEQTRQLRVSLQNTNLIDGTEQGTQG
jgi:DNA-binding PadR family transcriptional regulator